MEYITQKFILNKGNKINIRLDNPLELPGNEWFCGLKEFSLEPKWSLAEDEVIVNFQDGTNVAVKPINTHAAANIDTILEELFPKRRGKRSPKGKDLLGDITGTNRKKAKLAEETKAEEEPIKEEPKQVETKTEEPKKEESKKEEEPKKEEAKKEESKIEEPKKEDSKKEEPKKEEPKKEESNKEEEEPKKEAAKKEEPKQAEAKKEEKKEDSNTKEESKKEETTKVGTDFIVDDSKLVLNYEKGHYPEKGEAQKLVDEKPRKPDLVSSITGTQAKQEQKQQELAAQQPRAEAQFFDGAVMQKYKEEQKLKEGQKIEIPSKNPVPAVVDVTALQDLNDKYIALKKAKEEQKQVEEKSEVPEQKQEVQKPEEQKIEIPSKNPVPAVVDVTALQDLADKYNALKKAKEEKAVGETQKTVDQEKQSDITMSEKTQTTDFEIKEDQKNTITVSDETESKEIDNKNYENNLAGLKSIAFTKINNRYTVTFDTNHVRSLKLSYGFAQAIGYTQTTTLINNQFASDPPAVNPFYSHICIRMHGVLRPLNKNHDAEIAVIPIEKGKTIYSISPQPLYFKVEKTFIDTISLEFKDFLDNPIVCDRANGHFVLQFVKIS